MSTYIGFNLNSNRQIEHFQTIENRYGINSDGGKFLFGQAELALKGSYIPKEEVYLIPYQGAVQPGNIERFIKDMTHNGGLSCATHFPLRDIPSFTRIHLLMASIMWIASRECFKRPKTIPC